MADTKVLAHNSYSSHFVWYNSVRAIDTQQLLSTLTTGSWYFTGTRFVLSIYHFKVNLGEEVMRGACYYRSNIHSKVVKEKSFVVTDVKL